MSNTSLDFCDRENFTQNTQKDIFLVRKQIQAYISKGIRTAVSKLNQN